MEKFLETPFSSNEPLVIIVLLFVLLNILASCPNGIFACATQLARDTRNERTFADAEVVFGKLRGAFYIQYFLFMGLCMFYVFSPDPNASFKGLISFEADSYLMLSMCLAAPVLWSLLQFSLYHWVVFLFVGGGGLIIMDRAYKSLHILAGPLPMSLFLCVMTIGIPRDITAILLTAIFILTQIAIVFSGFKVFFRGFGSLCLFLVYLCTLELAPLGVIFIKFGHF